MCHTYDSCNIFHDKDIDVTSFPIFGKQVQKIHSIDRIETKVVQTCEKFVYHFAAHYLVYEATDIERLKQFILLYLY
jgi:excinuclease UvrABC helicase subunit UvrB